MMKFIKPKFGNRKITTSEGVFDSKLEYNRWLYLCDLERQGKIFNLQRQVKFTLIPSQYVLQQRFGKNGKELKPKKVCAELECSYYADFVYEVEKDDHIIRVVEDTKGLALPDYRIKRKLMRYLLHAPINEIKKPTQIPLCLT